ncbi:hypothetical protein KOXY103107_17460 [Komagataeibacter xylinus]
MHRLVAHHAFVTDLHPQGIEEHHRIDHLQRPVLPGCHFVQNGVGDDADQVRRSFHPIDFKQMALDLTYAHPTRIHRDDPIIEAGKPPPVAGDQLRIERSRPITGDVQPYPTGIRQHRLLPIAIATVRATSHSLAVQMVVQFGVEQPLRQGFLHIAQKGICV